MDHDHLDALRELAKEYSVRSPHKLLQLSKQIGAPWTLKECQEALSTNVAAQTLAPPPRSEGRSAAAAPGDRLQADLADFRLNGNNQQHHYFLQVSDVFSRRAFTEPLPDKRPDTVNHAMEKVLHEVPGHGNRSMLTTDRGQEFSRLDDVLPESAIHRYKEGVNDISVADRTMQTLKKDLEDKAQNAGEGWEQSLGDVTKNYNFKYHAAVHGSPDKVGEENPQTFMVYQDQAANYQHNRGLTLRRQTAVSKAGAYREPIHNGGRSFKPSYGEVHQFRRFMPGGGVVVDAQGREALLKEVRPVSSASGEPMAHVTFERAREKRPRAVGALRAEPAPPERRIEHSEGGSSGSREPPAAPLRRPAHPPEPPQAASLTKAQKQAIKLAEEAARYARTRQFDNPRRSDPAQRMGR